MKLLFWKNINMRAPRILPVTTVPYSLGNFGKRTMIIINRNFKY